MKIVFNILLVLGIASIIYGCEEKPMLFEEENALYFGHADSVVSYSFAKYPKKALDTLHIPVRVLGNSNVEDRSFSYVVESVSNGINGVEGEHFKVIDNPIIEAGHVEGFLPVVVYRTKEMNEGQTISFSVRLKQDNNFPAEGIASKQKLRINVAYLQKPSSWGEFAGNITGYFAGYSTNFGTWTPTKYRLILDALYDPETETSVTEFPGSRFGPPLLYLQYIAIVRNYIRTNYPGNYGQPGPVLLDPDYNNMPIQVGPANF